MRMVIGVDWSEEAFAAVQQATTLYRPQDVSLVHGIDLGMFQYPMVAEAGDVQGYDDFRQAMLEAGRQLMEHTATMVPPEVASVSKICEFKKPAPLVLDAAPKRQADLIAVGARGRGRMAELLLGSISHRIAMHAPCSTLIVKCPLADITTALVAIEDRDDADRIRRWLLRFPFRHPVALTIARVVQPIPVTDRFDMLPTAAWFDRATRHANDLVEDTAASLQDSCGHVTKKVLTGDTVEEIAKEARHYGLLVVGSHGRTGIDRFLLGSVSHALLHRAPASVLVVR